MKYISKKNMSLRGKKQGQQKNSSGCKLCGNISVGRGIMQHVVKIHHMDYGYYCKMFQNFTMIITD